MGGTLERTRSWIGAGSGTRGGLLAIAAVAVAYALPVQYVGWNQGSHYAEVRAFAEATPYVDKTRFEVGKGGVDEHGLGDISFAGGHYYAAKSPGLAFATLPPYMLLKATGGAEPRSDSRPQIWFLTLWGSLLPALLLLVLVRLAAERLEPGFGTAASVTLGTATMVLPFATLYFSHVLAATLAFSAFVVLWYERRGVPRLRHVFAAGVLAGLAVTVEYPVALIGAIVGLYGVLRPRLPRRIAAYAGGAVIGGLPALLFNQWAFGSIRTFPYSDVVGQGNANKAGLFGITTPKLHVLGELLFSSIGLVTLTPVVALGAVGILFLYRRGRRAEAALVAAVTVAYLLLNAGYETPFGGSSPGPRFLVVTLPFLALGFAPAYRRLPLTTAALAIGSAVEMATLTLTDPTRAPDHGWFQRFASGRFVETTTGLLGIPHVAVPLFLGALLAAAGLAALASSRPHVSRRETTRALLAVGGWILVASRGQHVFEHDGTLAALALVGGVCLTVILVPQAFLRAAGARTRPR